MRFWKSKLLIFSFLVLIIYNYYPEGNKLNVKDRITMIKVDKSDKIMYVFSANKLLKAYPISLGNSIGDKEYEGDRKTPNGKYSIDSKNSKSRFHKNLGISYPNKEDKIEAQKIGKSAGGDIKIHGLRNGFGVLSKLHRIFNWTNGCIALTNREMDELYNHTNVGATIYIYE